MRANDEAKAAIEATLGDMRHALSDLECALADEQEAICGLDSEALDHASAAKQALLLRLEQLDTERRQLLRATSAASHVQGETWPAIEQALRNCQAINLRNGSLVNRRLDQVREALSILTGGSGKEGRLYNQAGGTYTGLRSRVLAEA